MLQSTLIAALLLCLGSIYITNAQENAMLQIPPSLVECYNTSYFMNRDNRLPSTIETLITLIEKVENSYGYNQNIRQLAVSLLHRFRQDGIQRAPGILNTPGIIPYSPTGFQFPKFRILLTRLIPGNAFSFPNSSLTREERCSLHFMLSSSFDTRVRGDESQSCNRLSQYRASRIKRASPQQRNNFLGDVEFLENLSKRSPRARSAMQQEMDWGWNEAQSGTDTTQVSQCPVENGVIWTPWGTVSAGTLIAGIAAGLQQQSVQLRTLLALARRGSGQMAAQTTIVSIDNRWAATLAGDLAEVALVQVPTSTSETASVGANGGWNSTVMPKWYFLTQRQNMEMTDAEIRGGLDGLILAMNVAQWHTQSSSLKLSQLLRMYYSLDGVLGTNYMACNRKTLFPTIAPLNTMIAQTSAFAQVLDREMQLRVTLQPEAIANFSTLAANALTAYVPQYLNDASCPVGNAAQDDIITPMTNIYVFLDTTWQYETIVNYVNYVLQKLNINPYASMVTMLSAGDGTVIVNTTNYLADVYAKWNITTHSLYMPGFTLPVILRTIQNLTQTYMNAQQTNSSVGGRSLVALLVPYTQSISDADSSYSITQLQYLSEQVPDLRFVYYGAGQMNRFNNFVQDPNQDLFQVNTGTTDIASSSSPVVNRIKNFPRRIINPRCGASWSPNSYGSDSMNQYARPGVINFYRMMPNYFFGAGNNRYVTIQAQSGLQFTVCSSRSIVLPMSNATTTTANSNDQSCVQISSSTYTYDLSNPCNGYKTIHECPPLYLSVQAPQASSSGSGSGSSITVSCTDAACQTPDQAKYVVSVSNLGCFSGVAQLVASFATILIAFGLHIILQ